MIKIIRLLALIVIPIVAHAASKNNDFDGTIWCTYGNDNVPGTILYFKGTHYVEIYPSFKGGYIKPKECVKYFVAHKNKITEIVSLCIPSLPPYIYDSKYSILTLTWPMGKGITIYKNLSEKEANEIIKNFSLSDIDFSKLEIRRSE
ncbi:MAG: hypothetical protein J6P03_00305 [Opitutales bacterium]|nr:hypothetical protein [Opitutales bacterium]